MIHEKCPYCKSEDIEQSEVENWYCNDCWNYFDEPQTHSDDPTDHKCEPEDDPKHLDNQ